MILEKLKAATLLTTMVFGLAACAVQAVPQTIVAGSDPIPAKAAKLQAPKGPNRILIRRDDARGERSLCLLDPDGKNEKVISDKVSKFSVVGARLAPDGKRIAAIVYGNQKPGEDPDKPYLYVRALDEKEPGVYLGVAAHCYVWSHDGTELACSEFEETAEDQIPYEATHFIVNVKTKAKTALKLPRDHVIVGWSADGKLFLTEHHGDKPKRFSRLFLMNRDGTEHKALTSEKERAICGRLSPDGKRVMYAVIAPPPEKPTRITQHEVVILDIATGKVAKVQDLPLNVQLLDFCWSPDGKQIAYLWRSVAEGGADEDVLSKETESHLMVCDPDGKNQKTILSEKGTGIGMALSELDWR